MTVYCVELDFNGTIIRRKKICCTAYYKTKERYQVLKDFRPGTFHLLLFTSLKIFYLYCYLNQQYTTFFFYCHLNLDLLNIYFYPPMQHLFLLLKQPHQMKLIYLFCPCILKISLNLFQISWSVLEYDISTAPIFSYVIDRIPSCIASWSWSAVSLLILIICLKSVMCTYFCFVFAFIYLAWI